MNNELRSLYEADQNERKQWAATGNINDQMLREHDAQRRQRAAELMAAGALRVAEDYYHAAMIFQRGETVQDVWQAHQLASTAATLGCSPARWLAAASLDRWLMYQGRPQRYGTQFVEEDGRHYRLWDVDPMTTDVQRAANDVPPLVEQYKHIDRLTRKYLRSPAREPERDKQY